MGCVASGQRSFSSDYLIGPKVATGTFSQTRVVTDRKTGEVRAAKLRSAPYEVADCQFETELLSELNYAGRSGCARPKNCNTDPQADDARESESSNRGVQYLLRFYGAYSEKTFFCEIFELCEGGELMYLDPEEEVTEADVARWIRQLLMAVEALHIRSIVHRNVNPSSVLLREKGRQNIRLGGFGLACRVSGHELLKDACGSTAYLAPEILIGNYGRKVDIWAVGVLLYIFLFGRFPFIASDTFRLFKNIIEEEPPWTYIPTRDLPWPCSDHSMSSLSSETILCTAACPPFRSVAPASCGDSTELVSGTDRFSVSLSSQSAHVAGSGGRHREKEGSQDTAKMAKGGIRDRIYPGGMVEESSCSGKLAGVSAVSCYSSGSASPSSQTQGGRKGSSGVHSPVRGSIHQGSCSLVTSPSPIAGGGKPSLATSVGRLSPGSRQPGQDVVAQAKHSRTTEEPSQRGESLVSEVSRGNPTDSPTRSNSCCKSDCKERASSGGLEKTGDSSDLGADSASQVKRTATAGENEDTESDPSPAGRYTLSMSHQTRPPSRGSTEVCQALSATYEGARVRDDAAANGHRLCISLSSGFGRDGTATASKEEGKLQKTCFGAEIVELSSNKIPTVALSDVQEKGDKGAGRKNDGDAEGSGFVGPRSSSEFVGKGSPRRKSWRDGGDDDAYTPAPAAVELCKSLLQKNFLGRPTATEALAHPWLQEGEQDGTALDLPVYQLNGQVAGTLF
ncbi:ulk kinase [Cystoisospora suis]|uniref:Ulk kinase n=1 Tax=Cystoisospora suis TaxID=483139 RepID=A0A2C6KSR1_9APIC|nr:ulk kinase [Cystoisospora suis]